MTNAIIIEDDRLLTELISVTLEQFGFEVLGIAHDGVSGLDLFRDKRPAVVFLDIDMPVKNGVTVLREILEIDPKAKVIMLTAHTNTGLIDDCLLAGAADYVDKTTPINEWKSRFDAVQKSLA